MPESGACRILVLEDEWLIAESLADDLGLEGYAVAGPAHSISQAKDVLAEGAIDGAILDIDLRGEKSFPFAEILAEQGIPFVFMSGYANADLPAQLRGAPLVSKPVSRAQLALALNNILQDRDCAEAQTH
jgi:DNA-binding response OmpR family regulator